MLVLVDKANNVVSFPYSLSKFKKDFPNVILGQNLTEESYKKLGLYTVTKQEVEQYDRRNFSLSWKSAPELDNGKWVLKYDIIPLNETTLQRKLSLIEKNARSIRDKYLLESDKLVLPYLEKGLPVPENIQKYRQELRDATTQPEFPHMIYWPKLEP